MAVEILHAWACDGICGKRELVPAPQGKSLHPEGWRHVDGVVWCGAPDCRDVVVKKYRAVVIANARDQVTEFERVANREERLDA